jgi:hypothetical protein
MLKLRKFLCWCFGFSGLFLVLFPLAVVTVVLSEPNVQKIPSITLGSSVLIVCALAMAVPFGMAWWTVRRNKAFARGWAIAASIEFVLIGILENLPHRFATHRVHHFGIFDGAMLVLGIAGLVAFARRGAMAQPLAAAKAPRISGDGTSGFLDVIAWLFAIAGYMVVMGRWYRWGHDHHLPISHGLLFWLMFALVILIEITAHELGHTLTGLALGMKLRAFIVGPFQWRIRDGRWKFQFLPAKLLSGGGATAMVPTNPQQSRWNEMCMIAAGPLASLFTGVIAQVGALTAIGRPYEQAWQFFALISTFGFIMFAVNLVPIRPEAFYSDGARIYQLLRGGPWADLQRALAVAASTSVTPLRPRDYDIEAIQRAASAFPQGRQALVLSLLASSYYLDCGKIPEACEATAEGERIFRESALDIPAELCMAFVFRTAFLCRDAAGARQWWERMEAKKPTHFGADYRLAQCALLWVEGRLEESREAWNKADVLVQQLPAAGDYEFDRYRCTLLRQALGEAPAVA